MNVTASLSDQLTPFLVDRAGVRGRMVRLTAAAQTILSRYDYPEAVARLLGELLLVAAMHLYERLRPASAPGVPKGTALGVEGPITQR